MSAAEEERKLVTNVHRLAQGVRLTHVKRTIKRAARESGSAREDRSSVLVAMGNGMWTGKNTGGEREEKDQCFHQDKHLPEVKKQCFLLPGM